MSETQPEVVVNEVAIPANPKKSLPIWAVLLVLLVVLGGVGAVYSNLLKEPPPHVLPNKKVKPGE